jgi:hypothetical protein
MIGSCECNQCCFGASVVLLAGEQRMGSGKELECALTTTFFVTAV